MWRQAWAKIIRAARRLHLENEGNVAIELALVAPILVVLMTGAWDFGNAILQRERLSSAARAAASYALQSATAATDFAGMIKAARDDANDPTNSLTIAAQQTCTCPGGGAAVSCTSVCAGNIPPWTYVKVNVQEAYNTIVSYPFISNPITLTGQLTMRTQ